MNLSTVRHIKSLAKRLKKENKTLSYCQCLDLVAKQFHGARHFHELRNTVLTDEVIFFSIASKSETDIRCNDWPYFHIPAFNHSTFKPSDKPIHV